MILAAAVFLESIDLRGEVLIARAHPGVDRLNRPTAASSSLPPSLDRCLATTNVIESPQSGVRKKTGNVCRWRDGEMILRWVAGAFLLTEKNFRKIMGYQELWALAGILGRTNIVTASQKEKVA